MGASSKDKIVINPNSILDATDEYYLLMDNSFTKPIESNQVPKYIKQHEVDLTETLKEISEVDKEIKELQGERKKLVEKIVSVKRRIQQWERRNSLTPQKSLMEYKKG